MAFIALERITGRQIAASIFQFLQENGIDAKNMRGQGYDGASTMSSNQVGLQALIRQVAPLASYIHCNSYCLNLVISKSCSLPAIRNITDQLQHYCRFFLHSPKRAGILQHIVKDNTPDSEIRKTLLDLCKTRWTEHHSAYQHFYQAYCYIVEALEVVGHRQHLKRYGNTLLIGIQQIAVKHSKFLQLSHPSTLLFVSSLCITTCPFCPASPSSCREIH